MACKLDREQGPGDRKARNKWFSPSLNISFIVQCGQNCGMSVDLDENVNDSNANIGTNVRHLDLKDERVLNLFSGHRRHADIQSYPSSIKDE